MPRRSTGIPALSAKADPAVRPAVEKMRELMEVGTGQRGNTLDSWLTYRDVIDLGLAKLVGNPRFIAPGDNLIPTDSAPNPVTPPAPANVIVTNGFSHIFVEWDNPNLQYQGHAYATIYRATTDNLSLAVPVAQTDSFAFADLGVQRGATYYYWVRFTSITDVQGPPNSAAGTPGQLAPDPALVLDSLTGQITETQLYQDLNSRIDLIDVTNGGLVNNLAGETTARQTAVNSLQQQIDGLVVATNVEIFYQTAEPVDADASGGVLVEGSRWFDTDDQNHPYVYVNGSWQDARDQLVISVQANLASEITARTNADSAQVTRLNALEATVNNPTTGVAANSTAIGGLTSSVESIETDITAQAADITSLESTVFNATTGVGANATAIAGIQTTVSTQGDDITSLTSQVSGLANTVEDPSTGVAATAAALSTTQTQVAQIDGELSSVASSVSTIQTTVGDNTTAIEVAQNAIDGVEGQYTVKIDANGYVAGYGLAVTQNEYTGAQHSEMIFSVDRFSVGAPGANELAFVVSGNQVVMDGALIKNATINTAQVGVIAVDKISGIDANFIKAKLGTASITNAYIGSYIQSDNYGSSGGSQGWYIGKNGTAIFNNVYARGNIEADRLKANAANIVNTVHIAGEAVTVGGAADFSGALFTRTDSDKATLTFNADGGDLLIIVHARVTGAASFQSCTMRLWVDGVKVRAVTQDIPSGSTSEVYYTFMYAVSGKYNTTVKLSGFSGAASGSPSADDGTLFAIGFKR